MTKNEEGFLDPSGFLGNLGGWMLESFRTSKLQGFREFSSNLGVEKCICEFLLSKMNEMAYIYRISQGLILNIIFR